MPKKFCDLIFHESVKERTNAFLKCGKLTFNCKIAIYAPMMPVHNVLERAYPVRGQVGGGWALDIESFLGPCEMASSR
jgi:hypothetical protein